MNRSLLKATRGGDKKRKEVEQPIPKLPIGSQQQQKERINEEENMMELENRSQESVIVMRSPCRIFSNLSYIHSVPFNDNTVTNEGGGVALKASLWDEQPVKSVKQTEGQQQQQSDNDVLRFRGNKDVLKRGMVCQHY